VDIKSKLEELQAKFEEAIKNVSTSADLMNLKSSYLGKRGSLNDVLSKMKDMTPQERQVVGPAAQKVKEFLNKEITQTSSKIERAEIETKLAKNRIDFSYTDKVRHDRLTSGGLHPVTQVRREIEDIFLSMGFEVLDGPHIEDEFHNFEALNIPKNHPARDMQDTFWLEGAKHLLRTHTSSVQVHGMKERSAPFRFIAPGKVFRAERTDASHEMVFHQLEGMLVDKDVSISNLIYFMKTVLKEIFKKDVEVRLRPGFFPFVEPGFELDIRCLICSGKGCSVCKKVGWVELLPCGMIHPNVLKAGGINPDEYNGFAFGLGLDRLVMMRYAIDDIRHIHGSDLRFLEQFKKY